MAERNPRPGARVWRFVLSTLEAATASPNGEAGVRYTKYANFDRTSPADVGALLVRNGWAEWVARGGYHARVRITDAGREAIPRIAERASR